MPANTNRLSQFWQELKRRRVVHVIIVYASAAFVIIELVNNVFEPLRLPEWTPTLVILILIIGFPVTIIISWFFDLSFKGIVRTTDLRFQIEGLSRFEHSIAVLPFQDISQQKDQEYFCDGMTENIIATLAQTKLLFVIARNSTFAYKNKSVYLRIANLMLLCNSEHICTYKI